MGSTPSATLEKPRFFDFENSDDMDNDEMNNYESYLHYDYDCQHIPKWKNILKNILKNNKELTYETGDMKCGKGIFRISNGNGNEYKIITNWNQYRLPEVRIEINGQQAAILHSAYELTHFMENELKLTRLENKVKELTKKL